MISYRNVSLTAYSFFNCIVQNITNAKEEVQGKNYKTHSIQGVGYLSYITSSSTKAIASKTLNIH